MLTVQEFNTTFTKAIVKHFDNQSKEAIKNSAMNKIFQVEDTTEYTESFISTEGVTLPTYVDESETPDTNKIGKGYKVTFDGAEFAHNVIISYKARKKVQDKTEKVIDIINKQKNGAIIAMNSFLEIETHKLLNQAFSSTSYLAPDAQVLCYGTHVWNSTGRTFSNLLSSSALDLSVVDEVEKVGGAFVDSHGTNMPLNFKTIVVKKGGKAAQAAKRIFGFNRKMDVKDQYRPTTIGNIDIYVGEYTIIETPWLTSNTAYFFVADRQMLGIENPLFVNFIERPQIQGDATLQKNLDFMYSVAGSFKFGCRNMPITLLGSPGA